VDYRSLNRLQMLVPDLWPLFIWLLLVDILQDALAVVVWKEISLRNLM